MEKKNNHIIRVALIGPESSAKSTLSEQLALHFNTVWVQEYSREYLSGIKRKYSLDDILEIAKNQLRNENELISRANKIIFADTELIISKVWCEDVFKTCPQWISDSIVPFKYDLYLLTYPDLEWKEDPLRENPHRRSFFFEWYERELKAISADYIIIKGKGRQRLNNAIYALEKFIAQSKK